MFKNSHQNYSDSRTNIELDVMQSCCHFVAGWLSFGFLNIRWGLLTLFGLFVNFIQIIDLQPSGPIFLMEGDLIEIPCTLDDMNYSIDDLVIESKSRKSPPSEIIVSIHFFSLAGGRHRLKFQPFSRYHESSQVEMKGSGVNFRRLLPQIYQCFRFLHNSQNCMEKLYCVLCLPTHSPIFCFFGAFFLI